MQIDLTQIILAVIALLGSIMTALVIPWMRGKMSAQKYEVMVALIKTGVFAAEKLYGTKEGQKKKEYVLNLLKENGYILDIDNVEESINAVIEAMVKELDIESK